MSRVTVLHTLDPLCVDYSLRPLRQGAFAREFSFTTDPDHCLERDRNHFLLIVRYFKTRYHALEENILFLQRLRERYEKVFFFDDSDGADSIHFELIDHVDAYYKKQLLRDRASYLRPMYRRQLYSDYYHRHHGVRDEREVVRAPAPDAAVLAKLRVAWNIGVGSYGVTAHRPEPDGAAFIQARFDYRVYPRSIGFQRRRFLERVRNEPGFRTEYVDAESYQLELPTAAAVLSPFGYGEICHRDFEAIVNGVMLVKPSMDHIETWPDVYVPGETYVSVDWDGDDLVPICRAILAGDRAFDGIGENALATYRRALAERDARVERLLEDFSSGAPARPPTRGHVAVSSPKRQRPF